MHIYIYIYIYTRVKRALRACIEPWALVGPSLGLPLGPGPSPGLSHELSPGPWWALGRPGALRGSGAARALGASGLPWALGSVLGSSLCPPLGPGGPLRGPWALRGPRGDRAQPGPLQICGKKCQRPKIFNISNWIIFI